MSPSTPQQQLRRSRIEGLIGLAAPVLDLVLAAGDRISKVVGPADDYIPVRPPSEAIELGPGSGRPQPRGAAGELAD